MSVFDTAAKEGLAQGVAIGRAEGRAEGLAEGREEGLAEGREEGEKAGVIKTAISLKALGVPTATISQATGLTAEDIDNL